MPSKYLTLLNRQSSLIEKAFIDFSYDATGNYSKTQLLHAAAYILLTHAEIETYIEERVHELLRLADRRWKSGRKTSRTLMAVCTYFSGDMQLAKKHSSNDLYGSVVTKAVKSADSRIGSNHGIREKNFIGLLQMVGYDIHTIDPLLVAELDVFGSIRGEHAHKSSRHHFAAKFDPYAIKQKVGNALTLLLVFDEEYSKFRKEQFGH